MLVEIKPAKMGGSVNAIESKSYAHRILLAAALCKDKTIIKIDSLSKDIKASIGVIKALGANVVIKKGEILVDSLAINKNEQIKINCIESGSTLRFILPIIAAIGLKAEIDGYEGLRKRPIDELTKVLSSHNISFTSNTLPLIMEGKIEGGDYEIRGDVSSQYITGLMFALPLLDKDSKIIISTPIVSKKYLDITIEVLKQFNIQIDKTEYGYFVKGNQEYVSPKEIKVQGDWSNAAFFLALGALNGDVEVKNLDLNSNQGDKQILQVLKDMGAIIEEKKDSIVARKSNLKALDVDIQDIPDLAPIISILMANASNKCMLKNVDRLKIKETDRLYAIEESLQKMGINSEYKENTLTIFPAKIKAFSNGSYNDHRMVMMQAIAASIADGVCNIDNAEAKDKSYPNFFEDYVSLKGDINVK